MANHAHKMPKSIQQAGMEAIFHEQADREACRRGEKNYPDFNSDDWRLRERLEREPGTHMGSSTFMRGTTFVQEKPNPDISQTAEATPNHKE